MLLGVRLPNVMTYVPPLTAWIKANTASSLGLNPSTEAGPVTIATTSTLSKYLETSFLPARRPRHVLSNADVWISEGDDLSLPCELPYTLWRLNNDEILYIGDGKILFSNVEAAENGTHLIIKNVKPGDAGVRNAYF